VDCTSLQAHLVFRTAITGQWSAEKLFVGPDLFYCGIPSATAIFTWPTPTASHLSERLRSAAHHEQGIFLYPGEIGILFFEPDTPPELYIRYKTGGVPENQTSRPASRSSRGQGVKSRGNQFPSRKFPPSAASRRALGPGSARQPGAVGGLRFLS